MKRFIAKLVYISFVLLLIVGCGSAEEEKKTTSEKPVITVAAASDLTVAFKEIAQSFERKTNSKVQLAFGSSGTLSQQIENGAPFDVFAAANVDFVEKLKKNGKTIPETQTLYARGRIGITTLKKNNIDAMDLNDLLHPEIKKIAVANPEHAPNGMAARQALETAGIWNQIQDKLVYGKSIADTLTLVKTGNAEVGIIAHSIITEEEQFSLIDENLHRPLNQAITVIKESPQEELARNFVNYVTGSEGREILQKYGFTMPEGE